MIIVIGASGLIGSAVLDALRTSGCDSEGSSSRPDIAANQRLLCLDALSSGTWRNLPSQIDAVLICTARSGLAECRREPRATRFLNVDAVAALAAECASRGAFVVVPSTSYVYDGSRPDFAPTDPVCPRCEYGRQKADLERQLPADGAIVRMTKILTGENKLLQSWRSTWASNGSVIASADARVSLVQANEVARLLTRLLREPVSGIWHLSAPDDISWFNLAQRLRGSGHDRVRASPLQQIDPEGEFTPAFGTIAWAWPFDDDEISSCDATATELRREMRA